MRNVVSRLPRRARARARVFNQKRSARRTILSGSIFSLLPAAAVLALFAPSKATAATYNWSADHATQGGTGMWDLSTANWGDGTLSTFSLWPNANDSVANFAGTAGTVHLGTTGLQSNGLTFATTGYLIDDNAVSANRLSLVGTNPFITTNSGVTARISAGMQFDSWSKLGAGTLVLSGNNTATSQGVISLQSGLLQLGSSSALGGAALNFGAGSNASLQLSGFNATVRGLSGDSSSTVSNTAAGSSIFTIDTAGNSSVFSGLLTDGTGGGALSLAKTGLGSLTLSNTANDFSGDVVINNGSLIISDVRQLGSGTSAISINGVGQSGGPGFPSGQLILNGGGTGAGLTLSREVSILGRGPGLSNGGGGLVSIGNNTLAGHVTIGGTASLGNIVATHGITSITGTLQIGNGGNASTLYGNGNYIVSGQVTGFEIATDRFVKSGQTVATTLWLQNSTNSYAETLRIDGGTVRVSSNGALGTNTSTQSVDLNNGNLEIRSDAFTGDSDFSTRKLFVRDNTTNNVLFVSRDLAGSAINQTLTLGETRVTGINTGLTVNGRDGYNVVLQGLNNTTNSTLGAGGNNNATITNNLSGTLTLAGASLWNNADTTGARTLTLGGNGDTIVTGNIIATGNFHTVTKSGNGSLTIQGTASTYTGNTSINGGTLNISTIGALNAAAGSGRIVFGGGSLNYTGGAETWTNKTLLLNATNAILDNNGTGGLVIPQNIGNNGTGLKNLVLGGANTSVNDIQGTIINTTVGAGVTKVDSGNWQISTPGTSAATIGTAQASFAITASGGTATQTLTTTSTTGLVVGQPVSGTNIPFGTVITQIISPTQFAVSQSVTNSGTSITLGTVTGATTALNVTGNTANLLTVGNTANLVPGQPISGPGMSSGGWYISAINSATTFTVANTTGAANLANSAAIGSQTPGISSSFAGPLTISGGTVTLNSTSATAEVINDSSSVIFAADPISANGYAGGTLVYKGFTTGSSETAGILSVTAGAGTVQIAPTAGTNNVTFGSLTASLGTGLNFVVPAGSNSVILTAAPAAGLLNAHAYYNGSDFAYNSATSNSVLRAPVYGTDAGFSAVNDLSTPGTNVAINADASTGALAVTSLKMSGSSTLTLTGALTIGGATGGGLLQTGGSGVISGTGITTNSAGDLAIRVDGAGDTLQLNAPITSTTTGGVTKNGAGTLILNATNAETTAGAFTINEGTVRLAGTATLGAQNINLTMRQNTVLDLNGVSLTGTSAINSLAGAGKITNSAASGTATLVFGNGTGSSYFSGLIQDGATAKVAMTKAGTGTIAFSGLNTYTGPVTITGGNLDVMNLANIGSASGIGAGDATNDATNAASLVLAGGSLRYVGTNTNAGISPTNTPSVSINRLFTMAANGGIYSFGSSGNNVSTRAGNNAALIFNNTADIAFSGATGNRTLTLGGDSAGDNEIRLHLVNNNTPTANFNTLALTKTDAGLWILNPATANTYTGTTVILRGQLQAVDGFGVSANSLMQFSDATGGVFQSSGLFNRTVGTAAGNVSWTATGSGGFAASSGKLTVNLGAQSWGGTTGGFLGNGTLILSSGTALADTEVTSNIDFGGGVSTPLSITNSANSAAITTVGGTTTAGLRLGQAIAGPGVPVNAVIIGITDSTHFTISVNVPTANTAAAATAQAVAAGTVANLVVTTTAGSADITVTGGSAAGIVPGQPISGTNIPASSYVLAVNGNTITLNQNATTGASGNLAAAVPTIGRTIQVDDNGSTGLDFATVSGILSGSGGLTKTGSGALILGNANTYTGSTALSAGNLFVTSLGTSGSTSSSLGANSGGSLLLGTGTTGVNLLYVGSGETTTRPIFLNGAATQTIDSSGAGALNLTNVTNIAAGATTLQLRGTNVDNNMITSVLSNFGSNVLSITKTDGGVWILNPSTPNTFTGGIAVSQGSGLLGLTANGIGASSGITVTNGGIFAYGSDLATSAPLTLANNSAIVFTGSNNMTFNGTLTKAAGANDQTFNNNLDAGKTLTFNGNFIDAETATTATRIINMRGSGATVFNGIVQNNSTAANSNALKLDIRLTNSGSVTLGGNNKASAQGFTGGILLGQGTLIVSHVGGLGPAANVLTLDGGVFTSTVDLSGTNKIANAVNIQGDPVTFSGSNNIEIGGVTALNASRTVYNNLTSASPLTISGGIVNTAASTLTLAGTGDTLINSNYAAGTGANSLAYSGTGSVKLTAANTLTGRLTVNRGTASISGTSGSVNALADATANIVVNAGGTLVLDNSGGNNAAGRIAGRTVLLSGGTLSMVNNGTASTESAGALTINTQDGYITMSGPVGNPTAGTNSLTFSGVTFANSGSSLNLSSIANLGSSNKILFTTSTGLGVTNSVIPRVFLGSDFATYDAVNGIIPLAAGSYASLTDINASAATDTLKVTSGYTLTNLTASRTVNALAISGNGLTVGNAGNANVQLTVGTGAVLATGGANTLSVPYLNVGATGFFQVNTGAALDVTGSIISAGSISKALGGTLKLSAPQFYGATTNVLGGTLVLNAGTNTIFPSTTSTLNVNRGATLDLNGNIQFVGPLSSGGVMPNTGGTITSSTGTGLLVTVGNGTFAGTITGANVNFARTGGNSTITLENAQPYGGATTIMGGVFALENDGALTSTSSIDVNYAALQLNNNSSLQVTNNDRINDAAPIRLRGGTITFNGRVDDAGSEKLGAITLAQGANIISANVGGTGTAGAASSADLTLANLTRAAGTTINFNGTNLGEPGNGSHIYVTAPLATQASGVLGAWAIANSTDYAAYNSVNGVGVVGTGGFAGYDNTLGTGKIVALGTLSTLPLNTKLTAANNRAALLKLSGSFTNNITFGTGNEVLNLELGGLLRANTSFDSSVGTPSARGVLTAGGTETSGTRDLVVYYNGTGTPSFGSGTINPTTTVVTLGSTVGITPGMTLTNANFPAGTTVVSVDSLTQITVSQASTNATQQTSQTLTAGSYVSGVTTSGSASISMNSTTGLAAGMTLTGTGIPVGTYIVSVDDPTHVTLSQNATANGSALSFTAGIASLNINSVIADNGAGNHVALVKSGAGVMNLTAVNTYTGGTVVNQGTLNLNGSGVTIPGTSLIINGGVQGTGAAVVMNTNGGQIAATNDVTLNGRATLSLAGNNTLKSLTFNNNGGDAAPTLNATVTGVGVLTLTSNAPITATSSNAIATSSLAIPTVVLASGANQFAIDPIAIGANVYTAIQPTLAISSVITGPSSSVTKTGTGLLQLSGANTFNGLNLQAGGILISANSSPTTGVGAGNLLGNGPLGIGDVTAAAGTTFFVDNNRTVANNISFAGTPTFNSTANTSWTLTLNGLSTLQNGAVTVQVSNPFLTVNMLGQLTNAAQITSITKTGPGAFNFNSTGYTGDINVTNLGLPNSTGSALSIFNDGDGTGNIQTIAMGAINFDAGIAPTITVGRAGTTLPFTAAANKIVAPSSISNLPLGLTVTNNNGYGLKVSNAFTVPGGGATYTVTNATASNVVQGLYFAGKVSGAGFTKAGAGTLVLQNSGNDFVGNITVGQGVLSIDADNELGVSGNEVVLAPTTGTSTLRTDGTFTLTHAIQLNGTTNTRAIEVTPGNTLTVNTVFDLQNGGAAATLTKNDNGILSLGGNNSGWSGGLLINAGAVRLTSNTGAGTGAISIAPNSTATGAALQLANVSISNGITLQGTGNQLLGGINFGGQLQSVSGTNTVSGAILAPNDATIGADTGSTLNITGTVTENSANHQIWYTGGGTINVSGALGASGGATGFFAVQKYGTGQLNFTTAQNALISDGTGFRLNAGETVFKGLGTWTGTFSNTSTNYVLLPSSTLTLNNTTAAGGNVNNRLGTSRLIQFFGSNFNLLGNDNTVTPAATTETFGAPNFQRGLTTITVTAPAGAGGANLLFTGNANAVANAQNSGTVPTGASVLFRGTSLGSAAGAGVATIRDSGSTGFSTNGSTGATATNTKSILPWAILETSDSGTGATAQFATGDSTAANAFTTSNLRQLDTTTEMATNTAFAAGVNERLTANQAVTASVTPNSLTLESGGQVTVNPLVTLSFSSGGILAKAGNNGISGGILSQINTAAPLNIWAVGDLTVTSLLNGGNGTTNGNIGFVKAGAGTLTLSTPTTSVPGITNLSANSYSGQLVMNQGTLKLDGGTNTIQNNNFLSLNGGTIDLNGNSQQFYGVFTDSVVAGGGGTITSSTGTGNLIVNLDNTNRNFAGQITNSVNFAKTSNAGATNTTLTMYSPLTYTGKTLINGGVVTLRDSATMSGTSSIDINYATLTADNLTSTIDLSDRIKDTAPITLRGGTLTIAGRQQTNSTETIGAITVDSGFGVLNPNVGGTGVNSMEVTIGGLSRPAGSSATFIINGTSLGTIGSTSRVFSSSINGVAVTGTYGAGLTNNIVGGWAEGSNDFLTYTPGLGFAPLGQSGAAQYDLTNTFVGTNATRNIRLTATTTIPAGGAMANAVSMSGSSIALAFTGAADILNITSGGLIGPNNNQPIGTTALPGQLTAGGASPTSPSDLYVFNRANTLTINSSIIDNPTTSGANAAVRAVFTASGGTITLVNPGNSYTGGTVVNGGTLNLSNTAATAVIPLAANPATGFVLNGATVNVNGFSGQIAAGNTVTLNGNSALNLSGDNSVAGLVFNNNGGATAPTVNTFLNNANPALSSLGTLTIGAGGIKATSSNVGSTSAIVGRVDFGTVARTIDVDTINVNGVNDVVPLQAAFNLQGVVGSSGGLIKTGAGILGLAAQELFTGPLTVNQGGVRINSVSGGSRLSALTLNAGTRLDLGGFSTTIGSLAGSGLVFNSGSSQTLSVGFDGTSTSYSGSFNRFNDAVLNAVNLTKVGSGKFELTGPASNSTSTGVLTVNRGTVSFRDAGTNSFTTSAIIVNEGATLMLDDSGASNLTNRLSNIGVTLNGGTLQALGADGTATAEASTGALLLGPSASAVNLMAGAGGTLTLQFASLTQGANGTANFTGTNLGTDTKLLFTTAPTLTGNILARYAVDNKDFATYAAGTGIVAYTGYVTPLNINEAATTATIKIDAPTGVTNLNAARTLNALNFISNNATLSSGGLLPTQGLTVTSGGVLVNGNNAVISTPVLALGAEGIFRVNGNSLTVNASMTGSAGITKTGTGTLTIGARQFYTGATTQNLGNIKLAGGNNTIAVVPGATTPTVSNLIVNGGQFDLNGNNQVVGSISNSNVLSFLDGAITNSSSTAAVLTSATTTSTNFGGTLSGNLGLTRTGNATLTLTDGQTYTGPTIVRGGQLLLQDRGALYSGGTSTANAALTVNYGTFNWNNANYNPTSDLNIVRLPATVPVMLQGGVFTVNGGGSIDTTFTTNSLTLNGAANTVNILPQVNEGSIVQMTVGNLVRDPNNHSTLNVNGFTSNNSAGTSTVGGQGYSVNGRFIINKLNGVDFSSANLVNNIIGGWAVVDGNSFATYVDGVGVTGLGSGIAGMTVPGFTGTDLSAATVATGNYSDGTTRTISGAHTANTWKSSVNQTIATGTAITLGTGLLTNTNAGISFTGADATSTLAGTGTDLYVYINQNTTNLNLKITGGANLVKTGGATLGLGPVGASNDYAGTTYVQGGTLTLNAAAGLVAIPHDLVINNATVTMNTNAGQIAAVSNVTLGGGSTLTLKGTNTLASLTYLNDGGNGNPTVNTDLGLTISSGAVTSTNDTFSYTPLVTGLGLTLGGTPVITTSGLSSNNLQINAPITSANAITKAGTGSVTFNPNIALANSVTTAGSNSVTVSSTAGLQVGMAVSGTGIPTGEFIASIVDATHVTITTGTGVTAQTATSLTFAGSTFANGVNLTNGSIILSQSSNVNGSTLSSGPLGTGTLTIGNGTALMSDGTVRTLANPVTVAGNFTVGPLASTGFAGFSGNSVTFSGAVDFGNTARTIDVPSAFVTATFNGTVASTVASGTALTKTGLGTLILPASASSLSGITVAGGVLKAIAAGQFTASQLTVNPGATFDIAGFAYNFPTTSFGGQIFNSGASQAYLVGGTSATDITSTDNVSIGGLAATTAANLPVTKAGLGNLTLTESGRSNAPITVVGGNLIGGAENALTSNSITLGNATTVGGVNVGLDTGNFNQTIGALSVGVNKTGSAANINIASGKTLTVGGSVTLGSSLTANDVSVINFTGGGNLAVYGQAINFQIGGATGATNIDTATVDFTGLASLTANLGTGTFRVGGNNSNGGSTTIGQTSAFLPATTTITAANLGVGDAAAEQVNQLLRLGTGVTTFNVNTITVGGVNRGTGLINFTAGDTNGTLKVRAQDGGSRAAMNVGFGGSGTGAAISATVNLAGHSSDLLLSTLNIAGRSNGNAGNGDGAATFTFDTGSLDAQTVTVGSRTGASNNGQVTGTLNLGGGNVSIGALNLATNTAAAGTATGGATATVNVSGGNVIFGPIMMTNVSGSATNKATSTLNFTGGTITVNGDIVRANTTGTQNTTLKLAGASLDLTGHAIGSETAPIQSLVFQGGTLQNVGSINGTGGLDKTGADVLTLAGVNSYLGATSISGGTLKVTADANLGIASSPLSIGNGTLQIADNFDTSRDITVTNAGSSIVVDDTKTAILRGGLTVSAGSLNKNGAGTLTLATPYTGSANINAGTLQIGDGGGLGSLDGNVTNNGTLAFNRSGTVTYSGTITGSGKLVQKGSGTLVFTGTNNSTGEVQVQAGTLELHGSSSGVMGVESAGTLDVRNLAGAKYIVPTGGFLYNDGGVLGSVETNGTVQGNGTIFGNLTANSGSTISPGNSIGTLTVTGALAMNPGSNLNIELSGHPLTLSDLVVASSVSLSNTGAGVLLNLGLLPGAALESTGAVFFIVSNTGVGGISGSFANATSQMSFGSDFGGETFTVLNSPNGANNAQFAISYDANIATGAFHGGNDIAVMAVPEPGSATSLALGLTALVGLQRFRRRSRQSA